MGLLSFNPGNFSDALAGLSQGLLAYGSGQPQGLLTVPAVVARNRQDRLQNTRQQQLLDMEQQKFGLEKTKLEQEQSQYAAHQAAMDEFIKAHPEYAPYIKTFGDAASAPILKKEFPEPFTPKYQTRPNGRTNEFGYYDQNNQWHTDTTSPMDAPRQPLAPTDLERRALDAGLKPGTPEYQKFMLNGGQQQGGGPFDGTGLDAQSYNILLTGDPTSPAYAAAYSQLSQPKVTYDQASGKLVSIQPDMSWARKPASAAPTTTQPPVPPPPSQGSVVPPQSPVEVAPGVSITQATPPTAKATTEDAAKNKQLFAETSQQLPIVLQHFDELSNPMNQIAGKFGTSGNFMSSEGYQQAKNALKTIIADFLYSTSGATANPGEVETRASVLMPEFGEKAASVADKKKRVQEMVDSIGIRANGGDTSQTSDPLGIRK